MNNDEKQTLSQLMDGEWQDLDPASSVKTACADNELQATWSRYHLIRDVIRNDAFTVDNSLSMSISQAIEDEPTYTNVSAIGGAGAAFASTNTASVDSHDIDTESSGTVANIAPRQQKSRAWRTGISGMALAASVALATVLGLNFWQGAPESGSPVSGPNAQSIATTTVPGQVLPELQYVSNSGTYWVTGEEKRSADTEKRLNRLLSVHIESSPTAERTGMLPYSRLVGYDSVTSEQ